MRRWHPVDVVAGLQQLGFTAYEAKVYVALLGHPGSSGYEVARHSGVPRSKVYEVLEKLSAVDLVHTSQTGEQVLYHPLPHRVMLQRRKNETTALIDRLVEALEDKAQPEPDGPLITVRGYDAVLKRSEEMIVGARLAASLQHLRFAHDPHRRHHPHVQHPGHGDAARAGGRGLPRTHLRRPHDDRELPHAAVHAHLRASGRHRTYRAVTCNLRRGYDRAKRADARQPGTAPGGRAGTGAGCQVSAAPWLGRRIVVTCEIGGLMLWAKIRGRTSCTSKGDVARPR